MTECWCNDTKKTENKSCVVCGHTETMLMAEFWRKARCPSHKKKNNVVLICGECKHVCDPCVELGWISTAGTGGGDHLYNVELNLKIVKGKTLVYDRTRK